MSIRSWLLAGTIVGVLGGGVAIGQWLPWQVTACIGGAGLILLLSTRCTHRYATLLPPVRGAGPDRDHARWYCDKCGRTWDAGLATTTRPRLIYEGFDEGQAARAAARAEVLDKRRRRLAAQRADGRSGRPSTAAQSSRPGLRPVAPALDHAVGYGDETPRPFGVVQPIRK